MRMTKRLNTTWLIFVTTLMLITVGIVMVYSASAGIAARERVQQLHSDRAELTAEEIITHSTTHSAFYLKRQAFWAFIGIVGLLFAYHIDYETYRRWAPFLAAGAFLLCLMVFIPGIGMRRNGAARWINLGPIVVQASEVAKLAVILYMARQLSQKQSDLRSFLRGFVPALLLLVLFIGVIAVEPDLGAAVVIGLITFCMFFVSGMRIIHLSSLFIAAIPAVALAIYFKPYRMRRLAAFWEPESDITNTTYQIYQSLISVSTGGVFGLGLGAGPQKYQFLSEAYTDFIFAVICEELGMLGALSVFALYTFFIVQGIRVASRAPDLYGATIATGVTVMVGFQAFINMGVVTGLLPTKGLTLPLISYGGSSLLINCLAVGILMNISKATELAATVPRKLQTA